MNFWLFLPFSLSFPCWLWKHCLLWADLAIQMKLAAAIPREISELLKRGKKIINYFFEIKGKNPKQLVFESLYFPL